MYGVGRSGSEGGGPTEVLFIGVKMNAKIRIILIIIHNHTIVFRQESSRLCGAKKHAGLSTHAAPGSPLTLKKLPIVG